MRPLLLAFAAPLFIACATPTEDLAESQDEVVSDALPYALTTYAYRLDATNLAPKAAGCTMRFYLLERGGDVTPNGPIAKTVEGTIGFEGTLALPRSRSGFTGSLSVRCSTESYASATVEFAGIRAPSEGADQIVTGTIAQLESTAELLTRATPIRLALHTQKVGAPPKVAATNCKEEKGPKLFVRVRTSVWKDMPWTPPYGNDWKGKISLDGGKLTHDFRPRLDKPGEVILAFCTASEKVNVKVDVKEDDLFVDDRYHPAQADFARGEMQSIRQSSTQTVEGPNGSNRSIETAIEVQ